MYLGRTRIGARGFIPGALLLERTRHRAIYIFSSNIFKSKDLSTPSTWGRDAMQTMKERARKPAGALRAGRAADPTRDVLSALRRIIRATDLHSKQLAREVGLTTPQV